MFAGGYCVSLSHWGALCLYFFIFYFLGCTKNKKDPVGLVNVNLNLACFLPCVYRFWKRVGINSGI